jgi:hypothetical protein
MDKGQASIFFKSYPGSRKPRPLAGMSPRSGVSQLPRALPVGLHFYGVGSNDPDPVLRKGGEKLCGFYG